MIPKIIHQTWKTTVLPANLQHWHNLVKILHPGWKINLWTDADNLQFVKDHFPYMLDMFMSLEYDIMRVDIVRYMYMEIFGGYYIDLDYELFMPIDSGTCHIDLLLPFEVENDIKRGNIIGNCIFGSIPHHPFWKDVLNDIYLHPPVKKIYNRLKILKLTGPEFISKIYFREPEKYKGTLIAKHIFHSSIDDVGKDIYYKEFLIIKGVRGVHHCEGSWLGSKNLFLNRAPLWMRNLKLEWLYRLLQEPRRIWNIYVPDNSRFIFKCLKKSLSDLFRKGK